MVYMVIFSPTRCIWNTTNHLLIYLNLPPICPHVALPLETEVLYHTAGDVDLHMEAETLVAVQTHPISEVVAILTLLFQEQIVHFAKYMTGLDTLQKPVI
jgi:hypothetical protein